MKLRYIAILLSGLSGTLFAADYNVDKTTSRIEFSGEHVGNPFKGTFSDWDAVIKFDPENLNESSILVTVKTASANTGDPVYDKSLPTADWFDVATYPKATFVSKTIKKNPDGSYTAKGALTIKKNAVEKELIFSLSPADLKTPPIKTKFSIELDRLSLGLGVTSDANADYVGRKVILSVELSASPK